MSDDPRITAYALNEMTDAEMAAFEAELAADPNARIAVDAEVASIRAAAATLARELHEESEVAWAASPSHSNSRRAARVAEKPRRSARWLLAAAAAVVVGGIAFSILTPSLNRARETAGNFTRVKLGERHFQNESRLDPTNQSQVVSPGFKLQGAAGIKDTSAATWDGKLLSARTSPAQEAARQSQQPALQTVVPVASATAPGKAFDANDTVLIPLDDGDVAAKDRARPPSPSYRFEPTTSAESYAKIYDNNFLDPHTSPLSTFGIDVDTASYANVRRHLEAGQRPPVDAVRIEELINYFPTHDAPPTDGRPFAVHMEVAGCPWAADHRLVRVAIKGKSVAKEDRPPSNLVFLIDVSGSMNQENKLPLVKRSLRKLVGQLGENDRVAIAVYAGSSGLVLPSTSASDKATILHAIDHLEAGGSTNGGEGIQLAYATAMEHLAKDAGSNRVILCTDGDFNVGITDRSQLFNLIAEKAKAGVFLNVLGFGTGNTKDDTMEGLADKGNGQYGYIDSDREADKVFVENVAGTLQTIAKDVKLQLEFNPNTVKSYRLIGYENRVMAAQDFNNDLKDSGDLGAGHSVVALYEIEPAGPGRASDPPDAPRLKYQPEPKPAEAAPVANANNTELLTLKLRYKRPDALLEQGTSELIETALEDRPDASIGAASDDMQFAAAVAGFGMLLRDSPHRSGCKWAMVRSLAHDGLGDDPGGHRSEFLNLLDAAQRVRP